MGFFHPGTLAGYQERAVEHKRETEAQEMDRRRNLAGIFERLSQDESIRPEVRSEYEQRLATVYLTPPDKKLPSSIEKLITSVPGPGQRQQLTEGTGQLPAGPAARPNAGPPGSPGPTQAAAIPQMPGMELSGVTIPGPGAQTLPARYTQQELTQQQLDAMRQTLGLQGDIAIEQQLAERRAIPDNPQRVEGTIDGQPAFANWNPRSGIFTDPQTGYMVDNFQPAGSGTVVGVPGTTPGVFLMDQFPTDLLGNPTEPEQQYRSMRQGNVVMGIMPTTASEVMMPVYENGQVTYRPRSEVAGAAAPRTTYDISGMPTTGEDVGVSMGAPPTISETTQADLASTRQAVQELDTIIPELQAMSEQIGPLMGRITLAEVENLGGMGASPDEINLAVRLRRLLMTQAFENGGKQLTPTEKVEFVALNPALTDTFPQAIAKAVQSRAYLAEKYRNRVDVMPPRQRGQVGVAELPPLPGSRVTVQDPQGQRFTIPADQLDAFLASEQGQGFSRVQ